MDFGAFSISGVDTSSWYFLLATILPLIASLLVFAWGCRNYYNSTSSASKNKNNKNNSRLLKGSFGYCVSKNDTTSADITERRPSTDRQSNDRRDIRVVDNNIETTSTAMASSSSLSSSSSKRKEDKQPLINDEDDSLRLSDIDIPRLDDSPSNEHSKAVTGQKNNDMDPKTQYQRSSLTDDEEENDDEDEMFDYTDVPGKLKSSKFIKATKELEKSLTDQQKEEEAEIRKKQLESIFKLMKEQEEKFGLQSTEELQEQMKLYAL